MIQRLRWVTSEGLWLELIDPLATSSFATVKVLLLSCNLVTKK